MNLKYKFKYLSHQTKSSCPLKLRRPSYFNDGSDELLQEGVFQQWGPVVMEEIDEETLYMGAVLILERGVENQS